MTAAALPDVAPRAGGEAEQREDARRGMFRPAPSHGARRGTRGWRCARVCGGRGKVASPQGASSRRGAAGAAARLPRRRCGGGAFFNGAILGSSVPRPPWEVGLSFCKKRRWPGQQGSQDPPRAAHQLRRACHKGRLCQAPPPCGHRRPAPLRREGVRRSAKTDRQTDRQTAPPASGRRTPRLPGGGRPAELQEAPPHNTQ